MSQVHRVLVLNKPFKIRGYTVMQWITMGAATAIALFVGTKLVPNDWKLLNVPAGLFVGIAIWGAAAGYVTATEAKPIAWWKNRLLYALKLLPIVYLPKREEGVLYPDPTIREAVKREDQTYVIQREER
jgi:hypothetical protein